LFRSLSLSLPRAVCADEGFTTLLVRSFSNDPDNGSTEKIIEKIPPPLVCLPACLHPTLDPSRDQLTTAHRWT